MALIRSGTPPSVVRQIGSASFRDSEPGRQHCPECDWFGYEPDGLQGHMSTVHALREPAWVTRAKAGRLPGKVLS